MEPNWKCQLTDLGKIRERGGKNGMILDTPSGEVFVPLTIPEVQSLGAVGLLFQTLRVKISLEADK